MIPGFFEDVQMFLHDRQETHSYAFQMELDALALE